MYTRLTNKEVLKYIQDLDLAETVETVTRIFSTFAEHYGFTSWAASQFANPGRVPLEDRFVVTTWPNSYRKERADGRNEIHDPIIREAHRTHQPFRWQQAYARADAPGRAMMDAARTLGLSDGLVFPVHSMDTLPGGVSMVGDTSALTPSDIRQLHLVAVHTYDRLETLHGRSHAVQPVSLTAREVEVLSWAAAGKTSRDIGTILSISHRTVEQYAKSAKDRLGAMNLTQAVSSAIAMGLIIP